MLRASELFTKVRPCVSVLPCVNAGHDTQETVEIVRMGLNCEAIGECWRMCMNNIVFKGDKKHNMQHEMKIKLDCAWISESPKKWYKVEYPLTKVFLFD